MKLNDLTVESTRTAVAERVLNPVELVEEFYKKIEADDPQIGAYLTLAKDRALTKAAAVQALADKGDALPPLAGVPVAIKDVMTIKGVQATAGIEDPEGLDCTLHRDGCAAARRRRRHHPRQDELR